MLMWTALAVFALLFYIYVLKPHKRWKNEKVPHLKPWPIVGNFGPFAFARKSLSEWNLDLYNACQTRYLGFYQFLMPTLLIKDVELIKRIGVKDFDHFVDHRVLISEDIDPLFGKNLFSLRGQRWRNMRSTLSPAFTGSKMRSMFVLMSDCAEQFTNYFTEQVKPNEPLTIEMKDTFTRFANDVIATTAFGITCDSLREKNNEFYLRGKDATNFSGIRAIKFFGYSLSKKMMELFGSQLFSETTRNFFRYLVTSNIRTREKEGIIRSDMIHLLMEARKGKLKYEDSKGNDEAAGFATVEESQVGRQVQQAQRELSDDDITAQALLFFIAGFDTISTVMCHMSYELALNEDIQNKLLEEIDATREACGGKISYEELMKMKYLDMVLSETLRKWPALSAVDRVCKDSYTIPAENPGEVPVHLKKNDIIIFPIYGLHTDPQYFPNPEKFDPERFSDENKATIQPFTYLPFGVGPRNCIGSRFALMEAKVLFFHILSKFKFVAVKKTQIPLKLAKLVFNMNAEKGFWLGLQRRTY